MSIKFDFGNARNAGILGLAILTAGCANGPYSVYGESPNQTVGGRTSIEGQPVSCTITTQETGDIVNGQYVFKDTPNGVQRVCVSSEDAGQRQRGTDPLTGVQDTVRDVNQTLYQIRQLQNILDGF